MAITETIEETLAHTIWEKWQKTGTTKYWTYLEVRHLAEQFTQTCRDKNIDPQEYDFTTILDKTLTYYENQQLIIDAVGKTQDQIDQENYAKYYQDVQVQEKTMQQLTQENQALTQKNKKIEAMLRQAEATAKQTKIANQPTPQPETVEQTQKPPILTNIDTTQYNNAELIEIIEYLTKRSQPQNKLTKLTAKITQKLQRREPNQSNRYRRFPPS